MYKTEIATGARLPAPHRSQGGERGRGRQQPGGLNGHEREGSHFTEF